MGGSGRELSWVSESHQRKPGVRSGINGIIDLWKELRQNWDK